MITTDEKKWSESLFDHASVGLFRLRLSDSRIIDANQALVQMLGFNSVEEFIAFDINLQKWVPDETRDFLRKEVEGGRRVISDYELLFYHQNGTPLWMRVTIEVFPERDCLEGVVLNINETKLATQALQTSEEKFRTLAESINAVILMGTDDKKIVYANKAAKNILGLDDRLNIVSDLQYFLPEESIRKHEEIVTANMRGEQIPSLIELKVHDAQGVSHWIETSIGTMSIEGRTYWVTTSFDVTDRKCNEDALRESENKYRAIFETTGTATIIFDQHGLISLANQWFSYLTKFSREEIEGHKYWHDFISRDAEPRVDIYEAMRGMSRGSEPLIFETKIVDRDGQNHLGLAAINFIPGTELGVASFLDVTERKQAEEQIYRAEKMATLGQIIAGVAHEINNPNNFIHFNLPILKMYLENLRPVLDEYATQHPGWEILNMPYVSFIEDMFKLLENMQHGSARITSIVGELKGYVRDHEIDEKKPISIKQVVDHVMALVGKQVRKMVKTLEVKIEENLPQALLNEGKIEQVLINMLINAAQAADKENSWIKMNIEAARNLVSEGATNIVITIADNGCGMAPEVLPKIFDPFFTTKGRDAGTGLGLAIAQRIVEDHAGLIMVDSETEQGTTFKILLPAMLATQSEQEQDK